MAGASEYGKTNLTVNHSVIVGSLNPGTKYYYYVKSRDSEGNTAYDKNVINGAINYYTFTTTQSAAIPQITFNSTNDILNLDYDSVTIRWFTDKACSSRLDYGTSLSYESYEEELTHNLKHSFSLSTLSPSTTYYFKLTSTDQNENTIVDDNSGRGYTFTTQDEIICEDCEECEECTECTEEEAEEIFENFPEETFTEKVSKIASKTVLAPKIVGEEPKVEATSTTAKITWLTDKVSNSIVAIAGDEDYDSTKKEPYTQKVGNPEEQVLSHTINITGLQPKTLYHFQLRSKPLIGPTGKSEDYTFRTKSLLPEISNIEFKKVEDYSATLSWTTNIPCDKIIEYTDKKTKETKAQGEPIFTRDHLFTVENLEFNRDYTLIIKAKDKEGNETKSKTLSFSTKKDEVPPIISQVKADSTLFPGREEKVQTIISWITDEPSTTQLFYQEGIAGETEPESTPKDSSLTKEHFVVITKFKPATVYKFYVESEDLAGNKAKSQDFTTLTPRRKESVIQLIIKNFEQIFGWTKHIRF